MHNYTVACSFIKLKFNCLSLSHPSPVLSSPLSTVLATLGVDYLITPEVLTFTSGQYGFDGVVQCSVVEILDDEVHKLS